MQYVKLIAKPNTWFKAGTEAYDYDCDLENPCRVTLSSYQEWEKSGMICVRGIRICEVGNGEVENLGHKIGEERTDGECCSLNEFLMTIVDEPS